MPIATFKTQVIKYAIVGLANTAITAAVIFTCMHFGIGIYSSNAIGYVCGIIFSFLANATFTFSSQISLTRFAKFLSTCLLCWLVNVLMIKLTLIIYPNGLYISQAMGMIAYTMTGFFINKLWVMK